jgi:pentatricopeptide repeat protein
MLSVATLGCRRLTSGPTTAFVTGRRGLPVRYSQNQRHGQLLIGPEGAICCRFLASHASTMLASSSSAYSSLENSNNNSSSHYFTSGGAEGGDSSPFSSSPTASGTTTTTTTADFSLESVIANLETTAKFNQGKGGGPHSSSDLWDVEFVQVTVEQYEECMKHLHDIHKGTNSSNSSSQREIRIIPSMDNSASSKMLQSLLLSSETTENAFRSMMRCKLHTTKLSDKVRLWEKYLGALGKTPLTDRLSLAMLEANGKAGNIGRALSLLSVRKARGYKPVASEFIYAITAIDAAGLDLRKDRNIFFSDKEQPHIDNPTRWLDAILLNMRERDFPLSTKLANRMLNTFATTGKNGKAVHYFFKVLRSPIEEYDADNHSTHHHQDEKIVQSEEEGEGDDNVDDGRARFQNHPIKVRLAMRPPPPYHKIPSQIRGKFVLKPGTSVRQLKLERESDPNWSLPLTAAIAFADSLEQGACGHDPIELDLISYTTLIKTCVNRGSLWRAMHILGEVMPANGIQPDVVAYNILFTGLSRVGDVPTMRDYFSQMSARDIRPTSHTVEGIVNGMLNLGDVASAISLVQDCFNQHCILPSYQTHLKILEFALGTGLRYEAKRHVYFIQQLWRWEKNPYHSEAFVRLMERTKQNPHLSREALQKLFAFFGEPLDDKDFF